MQLIICINIDGNIVIVLQIVIVIVIVIVILLIINDNDSNLIYQLALSPILLVKL